MARRTFVRRSGARPNRSWAATTTHTDFIAVPAASKVLISSFVVVDTFGIDLTVLRTVGRFAVASDQASAIETQTGAWGLIRVTDLAVAAGVASLPGPFTDAQDDGWFVHQMFAQQMQTINTMGTY